MDSGKHLKGSEDFSRDIFLLTKPPKSDRARICLRLVAQSENAILYLAGDGVYNLLDNDISALQSVRIFACKEDLEARGIQPGMIAVIPNEFYERLLDDIMINGNSIYTF